MTYDIYFNDENNSNNKGFRLSLEECKDYIETSRNDSGSYFEDYKGGRRRPDTDASALRAARRIPAS